MKTIDWLVDNEPAGNILSTDRFLIQRSGASKGALISNLVTMVTSGVSISVGDLSDITQVGEDLATSVDATAARTVLGAAAASHAHSISDIDEYDSGALELTAVEFTGTAPTTAANNMLWAEGNQLFTQLGGEIYALVKKTTVVAATDDLSSDIGHLNNIVDLSSDFKNIDYTLDEIPGARVGDSITIVNTGVDSNSVSIVDGTDASVIGTQSLLDGESIRIVCIDSGTPQKWFKG